MDWDDIRVFLAVARAGSLGAAGRSLGLSHPTVARRLRAIEAALGQKLLQRSTDGFALTQEGTSILALAEQVEDATLAIERRVAGGVGGLEGTLRVSTSDWFATWMLPPVVRAFSRRHAGVTIELLTSSRLYSLAHREADLAFRVMPFDEGDVVQRRLLTLQFGAYASSQPPSGAPGPGAESTAIDGFHTGAFPDADWSRRMLGDAHVALRSNSRTVQAHMCAEGIGVALLPRPVGDRMPGLRRIDLGETPTRDIWMGYHRDLKAMRRLRAFADLAVEMLAGAPSDA